MLGLSPLTRGKPHHQGHVGPTPGLIPARAGKTGAPGNRAFKGRAHPRPREENDVHAEASIRFEGSSPLTRGKLACFGRADAFPGLIPTHAGKTELPRSAGSHHRAHPHSCGENVIVPSFVPTAAGSSPLMRGKHSHATQGRVQERLIPAHAGKTSASPYGTARKWAHPRSCGENGFIQVASPANEGSSPLTRGKLIDPLIALAVGGLIPAHTGKTPR